MYLGRSCRAAAVVLVVLQPAFAQAQVNCPIAADLETGISVFYDGRIEHFQPATRDPLDLYLVEVNSDEYIGYYFYTYGLYLQEKGELQNRQPVEGSTTIYTYGFDDDSLLLPPSANMDFEVSVVASSIEVGGDRSMTSYTYLWQAGPKTTFTIGACTYGGFMVTVDTSRNFGEHDVRRQSYYYLADLGIGLYTGSTENGEEEQLILPVAIVRSADL